MLYYMDATTTPSISSLIAKLRAHFPQFQFIAGDVFRWAPEEMAIYYIDNALDAPSLLHELSHAILDHREFDRDIQLIAYEQAAWHYAREVLAPEYRIAISSDHIEDSLDTYRDWLHARSRCPQCGATGLQSKQRLYVCLVCQTKWQVNDARQCQLRRNVLTNKYTA